MAHHAQLQHAHTHTRHTHTHTRHTHTHTHTHTFFLGSALFGPGDYQFAMNPNQQQQQRRDEQHNNNNNNNSRRQQQPQQQQATAARHETTRQQQWPRSVDAQVVRFRAHVAAETNASAVKHRQTQVRASAQFRPDADRKNPAPDPILGTLSPKNPVPEQ